MVKNQSDQLRNLHISAHRRIEQEKFASYHKVMVLLFNSLFHVLLRGFQSSNAMSMLIDAFMPQCRTVSDESSSVSGDFFKLKLMYGVSFQDVNFRHSLGESCQAGNTRVENNFNYFGSKIALRRVFLGSLYHKT